MPDRIQKEEIVHRLATHMETDDVTAAAWVDGLLETLYESFRAGESVTLLQHRQAVPLIEGKAPLSMATPEDIILMRLVWYRQSGNHADDQWNDLLGILKVQAPTLNLAYLSQQAETLKIGDLLVQALIDAGIRDEG